MSLLLRIIGGILYAYEPNCSLCHRSHLIGYCANSTSHDFRFGNPCDHNVRVAIAAYQFGLDSLIPYPLIGLSWMWERLSFTRPLASLLGIPLAIIADAYAAMMPSMGEMDSRAVKLLLCQTFPYTWRFWQFDNHRLKLDSQDELYDVFQRCSQDFGLRAYLNSRFAQLTNGENQEVLNVKKVTKKKGVVLGILSLVFGAIGIFWWPAVLGTIAVILGIVQLTRRRRKLGIAGLVLGIIDIILAVFWYSVGLMPSIF